MNKIRDLRSSLNLTQMDLGKCLGLNQSAIGKYERQELEPNIETLIKMADYFNCSIDYLVGRENDFGVIQTGNNLNEFQIELLSAFDMLNRDKQQQAIGFVKALNF